MSLLCGLATLAALACRTPGGAGPADPLFSLYDGIPDSLAAGSWRVLAVQDKFHKEELPSSRSVSLSGSAEVTPGSRIYIRLVYGSVWAPGGTVEAKLIADGGTVATASTELGRSWAERWLYDPSGGSRRLEITHQTEEPRVPLRSVVWLELPLATPDAESRRAQSLASWAVRTNAPEARETLSRWKFGLIREGAQRDAVVVPSGSACQRKPAAWSPFPRRCELPWPVRAQASLSKGDLPD